MAHPDHPVPDQPVFRNPGPTRPGPNRPGPTATGPTATGSTRSVLDQRIPRPLPRALAVEPAWYLHRPRLDAMLHRLRGADATALVLWDAAGSGKTTLMAGWARRLLAEDQTVEWFSGADLRDVVDAADLRRRLNISEGGVDAETTRLRFVFLDDLHRAEPPAFARSVEHTPPSAVAGFLEELTRIPAGVRLVVSGRHRPGAGTAPLEAAGLLIELTDETLAFTLPETFDLAAHHNVELTIEDGRLLWRHTGGWATGLALALAWRQADGDPSGFSGFDGDNPAVADYLAAEVVAELESLDQEVLFRSAVGEVVALDLAVVVSDRTDAGAVLERLARRNTLIRRELPGPAGPAYRYHPILLAYLQAEGRRRDAAATTARHLVASRWYAARADGAAALEQSLLADDGPLTLELLDRFGLVLALSGESDLLRRALGHTPDGTDTPVGACLRLLLEPVAGTSRRRTRHLFDSIGAVVRPATTVDETADPAAGHGWAFVAEILQALHATEPTDIRRRLWSLRESPAAALRREIPIDLLAALAEGRCLERLDQFVEAEDTLRDVAEGAREAGFTWLYLQASDLAATAAGHAGNWMHVALMEAQMSAALTDTAPQPIPHNTDRALLYDLMRRYERCESVDLDALAELASSGTLAPPGPAGSDIGIAVPAQVLLLLCQLDHAARTRAALDTLMTLIREVGAEHPRALSLCCVALIELSSSLDGRAETQVLVRLIEPALGDTSLEARLIRLLVAAPTRSGHPAEERLLSALEENTAWRGATIVSAWIALAHVAEVSGRHVEADDRVVKALRFARRAGCERAFLAGAGQGVALVRGRVGRLGELDEYARHVLRCAEGAHEGARLSDRGAANPPLTPREREVLRELPFHQSVANIARKRNVSPNTVKTHLRNIYQKLEAENRADAVAIAQDQGLL
jgi:LuxR family maltose regulon positive regulatory protein